MHITAVHIERNVHCLFINNLISGISLIGNRIGKCLHNILSGRKTTNKISNLGPGGLRAPKRINPNQISPIEYFQFEAIQTNRTKPQKIIIDSIQRELNHKVLNCC
jgi:hypothetical protein